MKPRALLLLALSTTTCDSGARPPDPAAPSPVTTPPTPTPIAPSPPVTTTPTQSPPSAVSELLGPATTEVLLHGHARETFVVDATQFQRGAVDPNAFGGYAIKRRGRPLDDAEHQRLVGLLQAETSYLRVDKTVCRQEEAYGLRVGHGAEVVELLFLFPCARVVFLRRASADTTRVPGEYIDPVAAQVLALLRAATTP